MRKLIVPLLLCTSLAAADESAADLFYRAFWLEQAGGDLAEAETLYERIVAQHQKSPEAPRAILGLCRLRAARGDDVDALVKLLETDHPRAEHELDQAREIAVRLKSQFDPQFNADDTAIDRKLKNLYLQIIDRKTIDKETMAFLADLGPVAHPMLRLVLRQTDHAPVRFAVAVLIMQRTDTAHAILEEAIKDKRVLFKSALVDALPKEVPPRLLKALDGLFDAAAPHLRASIARLAARSTNLDEQRAAAYAILTRAVKDDDQAVRGQATRVYSTRGAPDAYVDAVIDLIERRVDGVYIQMSALPYWANREAVRARIETILGSRPEFKDLRFSASHGPGHEAGAVAMARAIIAQRARGVAVGDLHKHIQAVAGWSANAASLLLDSALETSDEDLADHAAGALRRAKAEPGAWAGPLRRKALELIYDEKRGAAARQVLGYLGLAARHWDVLIAVLEAHKEQGIASNLLSRALLVGVGPAKAARLAAYCTTPRQYANLLAAGYELSGPEARGFFESVVPHVGAGSYRHLKILAEKDYASIVARTLLDSRDESWGWRVPNRPQVTKGAFGPALLNHVKDALAREPVRAQLFALAADPRHEIGRAAVTLAADSGDEAGTRALIGALDSPHDTIRRVAIKALESRGEPAADALLAFALRAETSSGERERAFKAVGRTGSANHAAPVAAYIRNHPTETDDDVWRALFKLAPKQAVELALEAVDGKGDRFYRRSALEILTMTSDPRRLDVFRKILRGELDGDLDTVLKTVADQYLIELGTEILKHLRSPDHAVRESAKAAIESLKFYVEAKKTFEAK